MLIPLYKVGETVRIKDYETLRSEVDLNHLFPTWIDSAMSTFCGQEHTIDGIGDNDKRGVYYSFEGCLWAWAECLLEPVQQNVSIEITMSLDELI